jgi:hypothetical protein
MTPRSDVPRGLPAACLAALPIALLAAALPARGNVDVVVEGCNQMGPREVGVRELSAEIGATVEVAITVNTATAAEPIDAFQLWLDVPPGLLSYVRTDPGDLTAGFDLVDGHWFDSNRVKIVGIAGTSPVPLGVTGHLAVVVFEVVGAGSGAFGTSGLDDDLGAFVSCEDVHGTSRVLETEWGRIKALFRSP